MEPRDRASQALRVRRTVVGRFRAWVVGPSAVVWVAGALVLIQLAYRAWALAHAWFLGDDFGLLSVASGHDLTLGYLLQPHDGDLQPVARFITWSVGQSSPYNWGLAAGITLGIQALADVAGVVFLLRLAGPRWGVIVPLGFYLFSVATLPGFLWWSSAIVQVPAQLAAFLALAFHLEYARSRRTGFVLLAMLALVLGLSSALAVVLVAPGLVFLSLHASHGSAWPARLVDTLWRQKVAWVGYGSVTAAYVVLSLHADAVHRHAEAGGTWTLGAVVPKILGPTLLGGPWAWARMRDTPLVLAAPPQYAVPIACVVLALLIAWAVRRRPGAAWILVPFAVCLVIDRAVDAAAGHASGRVLGLDVRPLGDLAPMLTLVLAVLATGRRVRPVSSHAADASPWRRGQGVVAGVVVVAVLSGVALSTSRYVANWHTDYPARSYVRHVIDATKEQTIAIADVRVPQAVIPDGEATDGLERPSGLFKPLGGRVVATLAGNDLDVLDDTGRPHPAQVAARVVSAPGMIPGCGYRVTRQPAVIAVPSLPSASSQPSAWWVAMGYLASADGVLGITVDGAATRIWVDRGLHTYLFESGSPPTVMTLRALTGTAVCVDSVRSGELVGLRGSMGGP